MALTFEQWKEIFGAVKLINYSTDSNIFEQIKQELKKQDEDVHKEWENDKFNINHLFTVTSGNTVYAYMLNAVHSENLKVTLLHFAIVNGHLKIAKVLLNKGAGVNEKDSHGNTSLHCAALHGDSDIVQILLNNGADVNEKGGGFTALCLAAMRGCSEVVQILLNNGADVNKKAFMGETALHSAALSGHSDVVQALLNNGANVNEKKHTWQHCLTFNCYTGSTRSSASSTKQRG